MRVQLYVFLLLLFYNCAIGQDTTKILFVGNSFTYFNDMQLTVKSFADTAHIPVVIGMHAPGGITVGDISQGIMSHMKSRTLMNLLHSKKWDFMVLQDNQGRFVLDSAVF